MKATLIALTASSLLAFAAPALAQNAGAPGATGSSGCGLSGSNTGTCWNNDTNGNLRDNNGYDRTGPGYLNEGRASAPDYQPSGPDSPVYPPRRGDAGYDNQNGEGGMPR